MASLFSRLFRYRPTEGRVPWEDHFTESFAAVLDHYPWLRAAYAAHLIGRDRDLKTVIVDTQRTFGNARPDMWIDARAADDGRHVVMVEHKMGAPARGGQLKDYERCSKVLAAETRTLVHIAGRSAPVFEAASGGVEFKSFRWFEIHRWLRRQACKCRRLMQGSGYPARTATASWPARRAGRNRRKGGMTTAAGATCGPAR